MAKLFYCICWLALATTSTLALKQEDNHAGRQNVRRRQLQGQAVPTEVAIVGGVTQTSAIIGFRTDVSGTVQIKYASNKNMKKFVVSNSYTTQAGDDFTGKITLSGLQSAQMYWYRLIVDGVEHNPGTVQKFETFPGPGLPVRISIFTDAAPYYNGQSANVYESGSSNPNQDDALLALQIGDFDHSDPQDIAAHRLMHRGLRDINGAGGVDAATNMFTKMAVAHVYDDHDYCGNDTDGTCNFKNDVLKAYEEYYPTYPRPNPNEGIYHSFVIGDAEIFMLDTRFNRTPDTDPDTSSKSMLGSVQKQWLKNGLLASSSVWKIIISTVSANKHARPNNIDHWGSFGTEVAELKEFFEDNPALSNSTVFVTGDLHSGGGLDGGCNSRFNLPELGVAHTNLVSGNTAAVGFWTEGIRDGSHKGYGSILISSTSITLENRAVNGNVVNTLSLPGTYNTGGCVTGGGAGLQQCSQNFATFNMPSSGDCALVEQFNTYQAPFVNEDGGPAIQNEVTWYDCPVSDRIIMTSNDIPEHTVTINNPNKPCVQNILAQFPKTPALSGGKKETDNILGFSLNGIVAFSPLEAGSNNAVEPLPGATLLDAQHWYGHPTAQHVWHYHSPFLGKDDSITTLSSTDLLGVAMDGFPIYGPLTNPDSVLDECNFDPVNNRYHIRLASQVDETLPYCNGSDEAVNWNYVVGCYRGDLAGSALLDSQVESLPSDCVATDPHLLFP